MPVREGMFLSRSALEIPFSPEKEEKRGGFLAVAPKLIYVSKHVSKQQQQQKSGQKGWFGMFDMYRSTEDGNT